MKRYSKLCKKIEQTSKDIKRLIEKYNKEKDKHENNQQEQKRNCENCGDNNV